MVLEKAAQFGGTTPWSGGWMDLCRETFALTKMDWNNDGPYDRLPVTLSFAGTLATIIKRTPKLQPHSYPVRLFM